MMVPISFVRKISKYGNKTLVISLPKEIYELIDTNTPYQIHISPLKGTWIKESVEQ